MFKIYAKNKGTGSIIYSNDDVMFYYVKNGEWLSYHMRMLRRGLVPDQFTLLLLANTMDVGVKYST